MSDKITDNQVKYLKTLMNKDYSTLLRDSPETLVGEYLDKHQVEALTDLDKQQASVVIGLLSSINKFQKALN